MPQQTEQLDAACPAATTERLAGPLDALVEREWLITNGRGSYASSTVIGCHTRRYHGLLVWSRRPPLQRRVLLNQVLEKLTVAGRTWELASFEFNRSIHPQGYRHLADLRWRVDGSAPFVEFEYRFDGVVVLKRLSLPREADCAVLDYAVTAADDAEVCFELLPLVACRDFHRLRRSRAGQVFETEHAGANVHLVDVLDDGAGVSLLFDAEGTPPIFSPDPDWWYNFRYRREAQRGQDCGEDLYTPGWFVARSRRRLRAQLVAVGGAGGTRAARAAYRKVARPLEAARRTPRPTGGPRERLLAAAEAFVARRQMGARRTAATILAGFPWFGDWGRDAFIALPGLLLNTGRHELAAEVLRTFAGAQRRGMIVNCFDDYGGEPHYNSVDASLWFVRAAEMYLAATEDAASWSEWLGPACRRVVEAYARGTDFNIRMTDDGLLAAGDASTQLTWMDAKHGGVVFTPRHGQCVEINALWHAALRALSRRLADDDAEAAGRFGRMAERARESFARVFWNEAVGCCYDGIDDAGNVEAGIRPNQIFAVSLDGGLLDADRAARLVATVTDHLLTPYGLRTLSPADSRYHGRYEGDMFHRDEAYHQGTVWPWLIGPYVEAYLRVHGSSHEARVHCRGLLEPLVAHLDEAGLGYVSEVFDGDAPHRPDGCVAQAWSVAELLRALDLIDPPAAS